MLPFSGNKKTGNRKCPMCPNKVCTNEGRKVSCSCPWHSKLVNPTEATFEAVKYENVGNISGVLLEHKHSQSGLLCDGGAIKSSSVIATLLCNAFYEESLVVEPIASRSSDNSMLKQFIQLMQDGNTLYLISELPPSSPYMSIEAATNMKHINISMKDDPLKITSPSNFAALLQIVTRKQQQSALILTLASKKSIAICFKNDMVWIFDSNYHHLNGGLVAYTSAANVQELGMYLHHMCLKYHNCGLKESRLAILQR